MIFQDDATPAGNGSAALALNRLGRLVGEPRYAEAAERCLQRALPRVEESPLAHASVLLALQDAAAPRPQLILSGSDVREQRDWKRWAESRFRLDCYLLGPPHEGENAHDLPGILGGFRTDRPATGWLCLGLRCLPPAHTRDELERALNAA
jgi:uncharacterized protein YyaL (SSP411 family)